MWKMVTKMLLILSLVIAVTQAVLPEEDLPPGNPTKWTSEMLQCFTGGSSAKSYASSCQQLQDVESCCRRKGEHFSNHKVGDNLEVRNILLETVSASRNKICNSNKEESESALFTPHPWQCNEELTTIFEQCLNQFSVPIKVPLEEFSFVECQFIYSMKDCTIQQILNSRSTLLLRVFNRFLQKLLARTLCERQENFNDM